MNRGLDGFPKGEAPYDVGAMCTGAPTASLVLCHYEFPRRVWFPAGLRGSRGRAGTAATAQTDIDVQRNGVSVGTIRFAAGGTVATFIMAQSRVFGIGDALKLIAPASPDATLADVTFSLAGTR
ncbi:MAG: hypothetical protein ACREXW_00965 [Gammaproteobacteria bacterium]